MQKRDFFPLLPFWLRALPSLAIGMLLFIPIVVLHGHSVPPDSVLAVFAKLTAYGGVALVGVVLLAVFSRLKTPIPVLTIDNSNLTTPLVSLPWSAVRDVRAQKFLGLPALCISTTDDRALRKRAPINLKLWYGARLWLLGAPIVLPAVREMPLTELCTLIAKYSAVAGPSEDQVPSPA
jgi:hypothetical protein